MIPEAAVEAATQAIIDAAYGQELPEAPEDLARAALEAANPHMLADVWDSGYLALSNDIGRDRELHKRGGQLEEATPNPYRPTP